MNITVLDYHNQALIEQVNTMAAQRAEAARAAEQAKTSTEFSSVLNDATNAYSASNTPLTECPTDLASIFEEAASTFGVSVNLLTSIARAESNFRSDAVSHAGAVGIMQLMPGTAASLGVSNSYDARENIMGGAKYIAQLLEKYSGNTSLALAAYNAGSGNVEKYGGIPPFTETQNYVAKVLSYVNTEERTDIKNTVSDLMNTYNLTSDKLQEYMDIAKTITASAKATEAAASSDNASISVTIING